MDEVTDLQHVYPDWSIRRPAGRSYLIATRTGRARLTADEIAAGLAMTLIEDSADDLGEALAAQRIIEEAI